MKSSHTDYKNEMLKNENYKYELKNLQNEIIPYLGLTISLSM